MAVGLFDGGIERFELSPDADSADTENRSSMQADTKSDIYEGLLQILFYLTSPWRF